MAFLTLLALMTMPAGIASHSLRFSQAQESAFLATAELEARRTFADAGTLLGNLVADVKHLSEALRSPHTASFVQIAASDFPKAVAPAPHKKGTDAAVAVNQKADAPAPQKKSTDAAVAVNQKAVAPAPHKKMIDGAVALKEMAKLEKSPVAMPAMLGLLTGMYDSWKEKIGDANKKEHEQKMSFDSTIKELESKKAKALAAHGNVDTYDRIEKYWKRQRSISHRQYHTALKIMHSGMQKFKAVSGAMGDAIAGKKPTAKDLQTVGLAMPDVVFIQREVQHLTVWMQGAANDLHAASELSHA